MGLWFCGVLYAQEHPKAQPALFKAFQKTGSRLKVSSDRLGEAGNRICDPWFTRHSLIPYPTEASFIGSMPCGVRQDYFMCSIYKPM